MSQDQERITIEMEEAKGVMAIASGIVERTGLGGAGVAAGLRHEEDQGEMTPVVLKVGSNSLVQCLCELTAEKTVKVDHLVQLLLSRCLLKTCPIVSTMSNLKRLLRTSDEF